MELCVIWNFIMYERINSFEAILEVYSKYSILEVQ